MSRANSEIELYILAEVDGAELDRIVVGNRLKYFYIRSEGFTITALEDKTGRLENSDISAYTHDHKDA